MAGIGAKTFVRNKIRENIAPDTVFDLACKKYPQVKPSSIRRYIDDYKDELEAHGKNSNDRNSSNDNALADVAGGDSFSNDRTLSSDQTNESDTVSIGELDFGDLAPTELKPEGQNIQKLYSEKSIPIAPIKLERLPKMIVKTVNLLRQWGPFKTKLEKWNDKDAIQAVADDAQTVIQNRLRISSKNADVVDLCMSSGNLVLSAFLSIIDPNNKPSEHDKLIDESIKKEMREKRPELLAEIENFEKTLKGTDQTQKTDQKTN